MVLLMTPAERRHHINRVRARLKRRPRTVEFKHIAERSGLSIGWIKAFARCQYEAPSMKFVVLLDTVLCALEAEHNA